MMRRTKSRNLILASTAILTLALAGCSDSDQAFDIKQQIGPDPVLPEPQTELLPDMKVAEVVGWKDGEMPVVAEGLTVSVYAKDLANPRTVHTLPNGDVLVVQGKSPSGKPLERPKDFIRGLIMSMAQGGGGASKESNLITLLRDTDRNGTVDERHDLLTNLMSPFGVAWADDTLYVAAADAILAYPYRLGDQEIVAEPRILTPLRAGRSTTTGPRIWRSAPMAVSSMRPSVPIPMPESADWKPKRAGRRSGRWIARQAHPGFLHRAFAIPTVSPSIPKAACSGP